MNAITTFFRRLMAQGHRYAVVLPALSLFGYSSLQAAETTSPEQLIGTAEGFLDVEVQDYLERADIEGRSEIKVNSLDPRLSLAACDQDLTASLEGTRPIGRVAVRIQCEGSSPWTIFVPAQVRLFREVVAVARPLKRAQLMTMEDVKLVERDVSSANQGYLTSLDQAVDKKLTRPLMVDQVISPAHVEQAEVIRKGDQVVISARSGKINVRMPGEALSDGYPGEQIRIRNLNSKRVIKARVIGPGQVEVEM
jgi:flagella basal body P-ring formation protein FlgA